MKHISILFVGLSLLIFNQLAYSLNRSDLPGTTPVVHAGTAAIQILSSPGVFPLAQNWANDYNRSNPSAKISVDQVNFSQPIKVDRLCLIAGTNSMLADSQSNWKMVVGRDVIVPVINAKNAMLNLLIQSGFSSGKFAGLFKGTDIKNWSDCVTDGQKVAVQLYVPNDRDLISGLTKFSKSNIISGNVRTLQTAAEVIAAVQMDQFAIGFCRLNDLRTNSTIAGNGNIRLLPIDKNDNGRLDNFENIYNNLDEFTHGVWIGKYPTTLSNDIYAVAPVKPSDKNEVAFLNWILSDGQKLMNSIGYCDLSTSEKSTNIASLTGTNINNLQEAKTASSPKSWPVVLTVFGLIGLFLAIFFFSKRGVESTPPEQVIQIAPFLINHAMDVPKGLYFDKTHTWVFMEKDGNVKVGLDDFLQHIAGKLTRIRMREVGESVRKGEKLMSIVHEGKQLNLYAPISGTILQQNKLVTADSTIVNSSPYAEGWVYLIEPKNWLREVQFMFMGERYAEWLREEFIRLKDFITASVKTNNLAYAHVVLQDGGELTDNVLADLEPEIWEDFQTHFIDTSR